MLFLILLGTYIVITLGYLAGWLMLSQKPEQIMDFKHKVPGR